jgi:hypothetical protein
MIFVEAIVALSRVQRGKKRNTMSTGR